jgi:hypothetical protein
MTDCTNSSLPDRIPTILRALTSTRPKKTWHCYQPCIDVYTTFSEVFRDVLSIPNRTIDTIASAVVAHPIHARLIELHRVIPFPDELKKLRSGKDSKSYIKTVQRETGCTYAEILRRPFSNYAAIFQSFLADAWSLVPAGDKELRLKIVNAHSGFVISGTAPTVLAATETFHEELMQLRHNAAQLKQPPPSEKLLLGCYNGKLAQGSFEIPRWIDARLFLFEDAFVVHIVSPLCLIVVKCAESWLVEASTLFGVARPIIEVVGAEASFTFDLLEPEVRSQLIQKWQFIAAQESPDFGSFRPISLGQRADTFHWQDAPGANLAP